MIRILTRRMLSVNPALKISESPFWDICAPSCINYSHTLHLLYFLSILFYVNIIIIIILFLMLFCKVIYPIFFLLYYPKDFLNELMFMNEE